MVGVGVQSPESHKEFCAKEGTRFTLLADADHAVSARYGSMMRRGEETFSARNAFLIDPGGVIRKEFLGVKPLGHSREVRAA